MSNEALSTLTRIKAEREARVSGTNPMGYQSEALRTSTNELVSSSQRAATADRNLANAMARLK